MAWSGKNTEPFGLDQIGRIFIPTTDMNQCMLHEIYRTLKLHLKNNAHFLG